MILCLAAIFFIVASYGTSMAESKEVTVLVWSHFIPDVDKVLKKHAEEFGKQKGVKVRIDTIAHKQFVPKKAAEARAKSGHDIIMNYGADALVYKDLMANVDDLVNEISIIDSSFRNAFDSILFRFLKNSHDNPLLTR